MRTANRAAVAIACVAVLALALRVGYVLVYPQPPFGKTDDSSYDAAGWNLATGKGFTQGDEPEVTFFGPVYPAFLALVYLVFGHHIPAVRVVQALLGAATVLMLYATVRPLYGDRTARWSMWLMAVYPPFVFYTGMLLTETVTTFLLVVLAWTVVRAIRSESVTWWIGAGIVGALNILQRQELILVIAVFFGLLVLCFRDRVTPKKALVFLLCTALGVGAWTARNYATVGQFVLVTDHFGDTLYLSARGWTSWQHDDENYRAVINGLSPLQQNEALRQAGIRHIVNDPLGYLAICLRRTGPFWITSHTMVVRGLSQSFGQYYARSAFGQFVAKATLLAIQVTLLFLGLWGLVIIARGDREERRWGLLLLGPVAAKAVIHVFLFATSRYHIPVMPFVMVFAAVAVVRGVLPSPVGVRDIKAKSVHAGA